MNDITIYIYFKHPTGLAPAKFTGGTADPAMITDQVALAVKNGTTCVFHDGTGKRLIVPADNIALVEVCESSTAAK